MRSEPQASATGSEPLVTELLDRLEHQEALVARLASELEACIIERDLLRAEVEAATEWATALAERVAPAGELMLLPR